MTTLYLCAEYAPVVPIRADSIRTVERTLPSVHGTSALRVRLCDGTLHECQEITDDEDVAADYTGLHLGTL